MQIDKFILPSIRPRTSLKNKSNEKNEFVDHIYINIEELKEKFYDEPIKSTFPPPYPPPPLPPKSTKSTFSSNFYNDNLLDEKNDNPFYDFNYNQPCSVESFSPPPLPPRLYRKASESSNFYTSTLNSNFPSFSINHLNTLPIRDNHPNNLQESVKTYHYSTKSIHQKISPFFDDGKNLIPCVKVKPNDISGFLYKIGSSRKYFTPRWCTLTSEKLTYFEEEPSFRNGTKSEPKGFIDFQNVIYLSQSSQLQPVKSNKIIVHRKSLHNNKIDSSTNQLVYCFDIGMQSDDGRIYQFAAFNKSELQEWFVNIILRIEPKFHSSLANYENVNFAGYMHLKVGISGNWITCWLLIQNRKLIIISDLKSLISEQNLLRIDLRKIISISYSSPYQISSCAAVQEKSQPIYLNRNNDNVFYIQGDYKSHTEAFFLVITKSWTVPTDGNFDDQLLTSSDVPIAIEKCLNFICTYGGLTCKNIYSIPGDDVLIINLYSKLKNNKIWKLNISAESGYTVHDVASTLKKYLRSFPQSLYTDKLLKDWINNNLLKNREKRLTNIKNLLKNLPKVNYSTLKKILCHFCCVIENSNENKMSLLKLAPIIGPVLFYSQSMVENVEENIATDLFIDLMTGYSWLFDVTSEEMEKERKIQKTLTCLRESKIKSPGVGGDLLVGVYIHNREWGTCLNVPLGPTTTTQELIEYIYSKTNVKESIDQLSVYEVVCDSQFERFLHYSEVVLSVIFSWTICWPAQDAKINYLLVKKNDLYSKLEPFLLLNSSTPSSTPLSLFSELKFSDINWGKSFKKFFFEFSGAKLTIYKDAKSAKTIGQWNIEDIIWYLGSETKRAAPNPKFCLTFIEKSSLIVRNKENNHLIGRVVCFNSEQEYYKWMAGMIIAQYPNGFKPIKQIINLLD